MDSIHQQAGRSASRGLWRSISALALLLGVLTLPSAAQAAGELDPTFDGDGMVLTDFGPDDDARGVAIQADGKIVAAGGGFAGANPANFELARYNPDGTLDPTFDGDGRVVTDFRGDNDVAMGVAIQADGKIVAAGFSSARASPDDFALARYNPDGTLDPSFDGDGRVLTDFGDIDQALDIAIQANGRIVAAGLSLAGDNPDNFALARYNPDGSLDPAFDGDGRVVTDFGSGERALGVAIQADGRIVAAGFTGAGAGADDFALARYRPDGSLDPAFDGDGRVVTDFGDIDQAFDVAIQVDGRIVAAGRSFAGANPSDFVLARYHPDGNLDPAFDGDGRVVTDFGDLDEASGVTIQADGRIVAVGDGFSLARYNPDGSLDSSFDGDGRAQADFGAPAYAEVVAIQPDGKIVAAGFSGAEFNLNDFALARFLPGEPLVNRPPDCSAVTASPTGLWPPNHSLRLVALSGATDPDGDTVTLTVAAVTQDEPLNGQGDGDRSPDAQQGPQSDNVFLRAERSARGDGRVYRVSFAGSDGKGGSCSGTVKVNVLRNMGAGSTAIDSAPPSFPSFGP